MMPSPTLPTGDHPVQPLEFELIDRSEEGFGTDEADSGRHLAQVVGAPGIGVGLDRDADPVELPRVGGQVASK